MCRLARLSQASLLARTCGADRGYCSKVRRLAVISALALCCCTSAKAALLSHSGAPVLPATSATSNLQAYPRTLVELDRVRGAAAVPALRRAGAALIDPSLFLWRMPSWTAQSLLPGIERRGLVQSVTPDMPIGTAPRHASGFLGQFVDPLSPYEWWPSHVGVSDWVAPAAGFPVTMIDSGVDLSHEEFLGRPSTIPLNTQTFTASEEELHGTATASVVAAPVNGVGMVGIYPQAKLQLWDASPAGQLTVGDEIAGLAAARRHGRGVVNLSIGGFDRLPVEEHAILNAFGAGQLVVASAGNDRQEGSDASYPASFAHVLTIGATDESDRVTSFSSSSPDMDLAAPGQDITAAIPTLFEPSGYASVDGTSFSAPLVSGAAAAVWTLRPTLTNTQLFEVMRRSARDVGKAGWDVDTGYGILNVPAALTRKPPAADPLEPNEDVYLVRPNGLTRAGKTPLTAQHRPRATIAASLERREDPEDVYRVYLPAKGKIVVTVRPNANLDLELWGKRTTTVFEHGTLAKRDLLGVSTHAGAKFERITLKGRGSGQFVYADVFLPKNGIQAAYKLSVAPAAR
jgi:subtilisin family serine protease